MEKIEFPLVEEAKYDIKVPKVFLKLDTYWKAEIAQKVNLEKKICDLCAPFRNLSAAKIKEGYKKEKENALKQFEERVDNIKKKHNLLFKRWDKMIAIRVKEDIEDEDNKKLEEQKKMQKVVEEEDKTEFEKVEKKEKGVEQDEKKETLPPKDEKLEGEKMVEVVVKKTDPTPVEVTQKVEKEPEPITKPVEEKKDEIVKIEEGKAEEKNEEEGEVTEEKKVEQIVKTEEKKEKKTTEVKNEEVKKPEENEETPTTEKEKDVLEKPKEATITIEKKEEKTVKKDDDDEKPKETTSDEKKEEGEPSTPLEKLDVQKEPVKEQKSVEKEDVKEDPLKKEVKEELPKPTKPSMVLISTPMPSKDNQSAFEYKEDMKEEIAENSEIKTKPKIIVVESKEEEKETPKKETVKEEVVEIIEKEEIPKPKVLKSNGIISGKKWELPSRNSGKIKQPKNSVFHPLFLRAVLPFVKSSKVIFSVMLSCKKIKKLIEEDAYEGCKNVYFPITIVPGKGKKIMENNKMVSLKYVHKILLLNNSVWVMGTKEFLLLDWMTYVYFPNLKDVSIKEEGPVNFPGKLRFYPLEFTGVLKNLTCLKYQMYREYMFDLKSVDASKLTKFVFVGKTGRFRMANQSYLRREVTTFINRCKNLEYLHTTVPIDTIASMSSLSKLKVMKIPYLHHFLQGTSSIGEDKGKRSKFFENFPDLEKIGICEGGYPLNKFIQIGLRAEFVPKLQVLKVMGGSKFPSKFEHNTEEYEEERRNGPVNQEVFLQQLEEEFSNPIKIKKKKMFENFANLKRFVAERCYEALEFDFNNLPSMTEVRLIQCDKLSRFSGEKYVKILKIENCRYLRLGTYPNVEELSITGDMQFPNQGTYEISSVKKISVKDCRSLRSLIKGTNVQSMILENCVAMSKIDNLTTNVKTLSISRCGGLSEISFNEGSINQIEELTLRDNKTLEYTISDVEKTNEKFNASLKKLILIGCEKIKVSVPIINNQPKLEYFECRKQVFQVKNKKERLRLDNLETFILENDTIKTLYWNVLNLQRNKKLKIIRMKNVMLKDIPYMTQSLNKGIDFSVEINADKHQCYNVRKIGLMRKIGVKVVVKNIILDWQKNILFPKKQGKRRGY